MATQVVMPQMGESIAEGTITKWLVKVGEKVERDQPLCRPMALVKSDLVIERLDSAIRLLTQPLRLP